MAQHFLLSSAARTLSLASVARMSEEQAIEAFRQIRWADNGGNPVCPKCGSVDHTYLAKQFRWMCRDCRHQFSVTSGTIFSHRKMSHRNILLAIAIFVNGAKGHSALQLSRDLDCQYKTAFVLAHKMREAINAGDRGETVSGEVEIDDCYVGGYVKPANHKENRRDRRLVANQNGKREVVIAMREREGKILTFVSKTEAASVARIADRVMVGSTIYADEASHWDALHAKFDAKRINHSEAYSTAEACTNNVESFFSRLRRSEIGTHHHIAGPYLASYAGEMDWREDNRRVSTGEQFKMTIGATMAHPVSRTWKGYWQRRSA